jgi:hypothetical protein
MKIPHMVATKHFQVFTISSATQIIGKWGAILQSICDIRLARLIFQQILRPFSIDWIARAFIIWVTSDSNASFMVCIPNSILDFPFVD